MKVSLYLRTQLQSDIKMTLDFCLVEKKSTGGAQVGIEQSSDRAFAKTPLLPRENAMHRLNNDCIEKSHCFDVEGKRESKH